MRRGAATRAAPTCAARSRAAARNIARVASRADAAALSTCTVAPGVIVEQRVEPLARVGCYVPGRPLSAALVAADDRDPGARRRRPRDHRRLPAAGAGGDGGGARGRRRRGCSASAARTRSRRSRTAPRPFRASTRSSAPATATSRRRRRSSPRDCAIDFYAGPDRDRHRRRRAAGRRGSPPISSRRPSTIPTRARSSSRWSRPLARTRRDARSRAQMPAAAIVAAVARARTARIIVTRDADEAMALANRIAPEHLVVDREALARAPLTRRRGVRRPVHRAGRRRLRDRIEPRAADGGRRARSAAA